MKIPLFIAVFLLFASLGWGQGYLIIKGSVYTGSVAGNAIQARSSENKSQILEVGDRIHLTENWRFESLDDWSKVYLSFSNKMGVWMKGQTVLWVDNFEQYVDKDEHGKRIESDNAFVGNFRLKGEADFELDEISDSGYFSIETDNANLTIKSKRFYVETYPPTTRVECHEGTIILTNSTTMKDTVLKAGEEAIIYSEDGDKNSVISIFPMTDEQKNRSVERIVGFQKPVWSYVDP